MKRFALVTLFGLVLFVVNVFPTWAEDSYEHSFTDLEGSEWELAVGFIYNRGIVDGYDDGTYRPDQTINRAELLKIILESVYDEIPEATSDCFPDVLASEWYAKYVCFAESEGIVSGYPDGTFLPGNEVNFVEALKITELAYGWEVSSADDVWYRNYVEEAEAYRLIPIGIESFDQELTRGAMADLVARFIHSAEGTLMSYLEDIDVGDAVVTYDCLDRGDCPIDEPDETAEESESEETTGDSTDDTSDETAEDSTADTSEEEAEDQVDETEATDVEDFEMFDPELTYEGAYNGPLFATWEHVSEEADIDLFFEDLDRNGVNYVAGFFSVTAEDITPGDEDDEEDICDSTDPEDPDCEAEGDDVPLEPDGLCPEYDDMDPDCDENDMIFWEDFSPMLEVIEQHPYRIVPFFTPGYGGDEAEPYLGEALTTNYRDTIDRIEEEVGEGFMRGLGEIEQYAWAIDPDDSEMTQLVDVAVENDLFFFFHPSVGQSAEVEALIELYPNTTFCIHMFPEDFDRDEEEYIEIMQNHENLYFSVDADHMLFDEDLSWGLLYRYEDYSVENAVESFVARYDSREDALLQDALTRYQTLIEAVPDKVLWGTEMYPEYNFEEEVYDRAIKFSRLFMGELDENVQEKFAYQNALALFGEGAVLSD